jgi:transposase-like protein DUF772
MRGFTARQVTMLALVDPDQLIPVDHPIRRVKPIVEAALRELEPIFGLMYSEVGRRSIPPEHLLKASLLMAFYSIRSERQFCERLQYDLLFKWFFALPGRLVQHGRQRRLRLPLDWPWRTQFLALLNASPGGRGAYHLTARPMPGRPPRLQWSAHTLSHAAAGHSGRLNAQSPAIPCSLPLPPGLEASDREVAQPSDPAAEVVGDHVQRQPGGVGPELAARHVVERQPVLAGGHERIPGALSATRTMLPMPSAAGRQAAVNVSGKC